MDWTAEDRDQLRAFFLRTDYKLVKYLKSQLPVVSGESIESAALSACRKQGGEDNIARLESASTKEQASAPAAQFVDTTQGLV